MRLTVVLPEEDVPHHRGGSCFPAATPSPTERNSEKNTWMDFRSLRVRNDVSQADTRLPHLFLSSVKSKCITSTMHAPHLTPSGHAPLPLSPPPRRKSESTRRLKSTLAFTTRSREAAAACAHSFALRFFFDIVSLHFILSELYVAIAAYTHTYSPSLPQGGEKEEKN